MIPGIRRATRSLLGPLLGALLGIPSAVAAAPAPTPASPPAKRPPRGSPGKLAFDVSSPTTWLVGAKLHVGDGTVVEDSVVEVQGSRIGRVGGAQLRASIPKDATVVDLGGKTLTAGLIAAETQVGLVEIGAEGSTRHGSREDGTAVRADFDPTTGWSADNSHVQVAAIEGVTTVALTPSGGFLPGRVAILDLVRDLGTDPVALRDVAWPAAGGQAVGGSRAETMRHLTHVLADARMVRANRAAYERSQPADLTGKVRDLAALAPVVAGQARLLIRADSAPEILGWLKLAAAEKVRIAIVGGGQAWRVADALAKADVPVILQPSHNLPGSFDTLGARLDAAAILHRAGVDVTIAVLDEDYNVRNVTQEAGIAVANGLPWEAALRAITLAPAKLYGADRHYGTVATGKVANLVAWNGDPLELSRWPHQVWIRGRAIPLTSRQTLLRDRYRDLGKFRR
jgi:imidazolonepropionase-like amidohydrolase